MTDDMMSLKDLLAKSADADVLREMIGFAAERLMEMEVGALTGAGYGEKSAERWCSAMAIGNGTGRPARERSSCGFRGFARGATSRAFWSRDGWRRRR